MTDTTKNSASVKNTILKLFLGASLIATAPIAMADNNWKQNKYDKKQVKFTQKHVHKQVQKKPTVKITYQKKRPNHQVNKSHTPYKYVIRERLNKQTRKINKGVKKGQLVRWEAKQLRNEQRQINYRLAKYRHDGRLNRHERNKLNKMLDRSAYNIKSKRNNRITKYSQRRGYNPVNRQNVYSNNGRYEFVINW